MKKPAPSRNWRRALRRIAPTTTVGAMTLCAMFGVLIFAGVYFTRELASPRSGGDPHIFGNGHASSEALAYGLGASDPVARFAQTRIGHVLFESPVGDQCRRVLFDNRTGGSAEVEDVYCGYEARPSAMSATDRIMTLRRSFKK